MYISRGAAQRIVEHISTHLDLEVWVADPSANVLASTQALQEEAPHGTDLPSTASETALQNKNGFYRFPLHYADELIGLLIIAGNGDEEAIAHVAKVMAELIIRQATDIEQLIDQQWALNRFVYDLLFAKLREKPEAVILQEAKLLSIDLTVPRVAVVIDAGTCLDHLQRKTSYPTPGVNGYRRQRHQLRR